MQVEIQIDPSYEKPKLILMTASMTKEVENIVKKLSEDTRQAICGIKNDRVEVLDPKELIRIYANSGKVYAQTDRGEYLIRLRLYELEESLDPCWFVRISHSEIINLKMVSHFDLNFTGTICVKLYNGAMTYVSRRYVAKVKKKLGL